MIDSGRIQYGSEMYPVYIGSFRDMPGMFLDNLEKFPSLLRNTSEPLQILLNDRGGIKNCPRDIWKNSRERHY